ncbi:hypothetical protein LO762_23570 [Actinocorallia sp. API 0066]|uniref:hypothetical protein n=1 Tax=Actinocorallia sp. API 0066 TaxID=2896846 RepID=UPI001E51F6B0|nr:hypothetical protein [Actinocorallia sp. API 0066]MCD0452148.1 hypothetical protein [Actinocorallia sp. API 0066]
MPYPNDFPADFSPIGGAIIGAGRRQWRIKDREVNTVNSDGSERIQAAPTGPRFTWEPAA